MTNSPTIRIEFLILCLSALALGLAPARAENGDPVRGETLVKKLGCKECHTVHGEGGGGDTKAPEWADLFGTMAELESGEAVLIDEEYLRESIKDPDARVVKGYPSGKMPTRFKHLKEKDLAAIVAYIRGLSAAAPAAGGEGAETAEAAPAAPAAPTMIEQPPAPQYIGIWIVLGFFCGGVATMSAIAMSKKVSWAWVALVFAIPAVGLAAGVGWAGFASGGADREIEVIARQFAYDPPIIKVNRGDRVAITLKSADMLHGFYIDGYGIDKEVRPDETVRFAFIANKSGKFGIRCSHTCGVFHPFMIGSLIVEPNYLFPGSMGLCFGLGFGTLLYAAKKEE